MSSRAVHVVAVLEDGPMTAAQIATATGMEHKLFASPLCVMVKTGELRAEKGPDAKLIYTLNRDRLTDRGETWTAQRVEILSRLWLEGKSGREIATVLGGGISRLAVIGKAHRLGLAQGGRQKASKPAVGIARALPKPRLVFGGNNQIIPAGPDAAPVVPPPCAGAFKALPGTNPQPFEHRPANGCRWPIDDTDGIARLSCCAPRDGEHHYCPTHHAMGISATTPKTGSDLVRSLRRYA